MRKISTNNAAGFIAKREDFKTHGALKAEWIGKNAIMPMGQMPEHARQELFSDLNYLDDERHIYIVISYQTAIAWWTPANGWKRPNVRYSLTTSKHQGKCPV